MFSYMYFQGELRLAKIMEPDAESNAPAGVPIPWWHHVECFIENRESLGVESSVTAESFTGFSNLKKEDKDLLKSKLGSGRGKKGKGGKRKAPAVDETDAKRTKTVIAEEDEIQKQLKVRLELLVAYMLVALCVAFFLGSGGTRNFCNLLLPLPPKNTTMIAVNG